MSKNTGDSSRMDSQEQTKAIVPLWKRVVFASLAIAISTFIGLCIAEIISRFFLAPELLIADPYLGSALRPNVVYPASEIEKRNKPKDNPALTTPFPIRDEIINRWGWHDWNWPKEKKAGTIRIAFLGDSYAEGRGLDVQNTYTSVAGKRINQPTVETLNFGQSGQGTLRSLVTYDAKARPFQPDVVILSFVMNDVNDNIRDRRAFIFENGKPVRYTDSTGFIHIPLQWKNWIQRYCILWNKVANRIADYRASRASKSIVNQGSQKDGGFEQAYKAEAAKDGIDILHEPYNEKTQQAWDFAFELLSYLNDSCTADNAVLGFVILPTAGQINQQSPEKQNSRKPIELIQHYGKERNLPVLDLTDSLAAHYANIEDAWFWGPSHWTLEANQVVGEAIGDWIKTTFQDRLN